MKEIVFGIIGCGDVTEKKSGPAFSKIQGSRLKTVMRRDEEKLKDYARRHNVEHYTTDYKELLGDSEIDAVYIATPPHKHCFYTLEAAKQGKAVYVEKPMTLSVEECTEMMEVCKTHGVSLFVAYYRRGHAKFQQVKSLMDQGRIGEIRSFAYRFCDPVPTGNPNRAWLYDPAVSGGGKLYDVGSHMVDTLLYLFGDVERVSGLSENQSGTFSVEDTTSAFLRFKSGVQGTFQLTANGSVHEDELVVYGSEGTLRFEILGNEDVLLERQDDLERFSFPAMEHVQQPFIEQVVRTLQGTPLVAADGGYGCRTQEVLEALRDSKDVRF